MVRIEFVSPSFQLDQDLPFSGSAEIVTGNSLKNGIVNVGLSRGKL